MYRTKEDNNPHVPKFFVGTPLPEEKSEEDMTRKERIERNKYLPVWKQGVYDEDGRRLFHGAFKGGWDAGYNNSVGTKEGFTPLGVIKSSRDKKANIQRQKIEDFLDEEDLEDMKLGDKSGFITNPNFSFGTQSDQQTTDSSYGNSFLSSLLSHDEFIGAPTTSIGYQLLRNMGWRDSRAVGLNLRERNKKRKRYYGVTGITPMDKGDDDYKKDEDNDDYISPYFMDDVKVITFKKKDDFHGIGYDPFKMAPEFRSRRLDKDNNLLNNEKNKNIISMTDFSDDYSKRFKTNVHIDLYDEFNTEIDVTDDDYGEDIWYKSPSTNKSSNISRLNALNQGSKFKQTSLSSSSSSIRGFVKSKKPFKMDYFDPPEIPRDYTPKMMPGKRRLPSNVSIPSSNNNNNKYGTLTPSMRSAILGEIDNINQNKKVYNSLPVDENTLYFKDDPEKSKRYLLWMKKLNGEDVEWDKGLSFDQKVKENEDFVRLWNMTKPLSGYIADKFTRPTTLSTLEDDKKKKISDNNSNDQINNNSTSLINNQFKRKIEHWVPEPLLCRRMGIDIKRM